MGMDMSGCNLSVFISQMEELSDPLTQNDGSAGIGLLMRRLISDRDDRRKTRKDHWNLKLFSTH